MPGWDRSCGLEPAFAKLGEHAADGFEPADSGSCGGRDRTRGAVQRFRAGCGIRATPSCAHWRRPGRNADHQPGVPPYSADLDALVLRACDHVGGRNMGFWYRSRYPSMAGSGGVAFSAVRTDEVGRAHDGGRVPSSQGIATGLERERDHRRDSACAHGVYHAATGPGNGSAGRRKRLFYIIPGRVALAADWVNSDCVSRACTGPVAGHGRIPT